MIDDFISTHHILLMHLLSTVKWHNNKKCVHYTKQCNQLTSISENKVRNARSSYLAMVRLQSKYCLISSYNMKFRKKLFLCPF